HNRVGRHVAGDNAAGTNHRVLTDRNVGEDRCTGTDGGTFSDESRLDSPVLLCFERTVRTCGEGVRIVDERHTVAHENVVLDGHAFADKRVTGDLTVLSDLGVLLNLDEGTDFCVVTDIAPVKVDELR